MSTSYWLDRSNSKPINHYDIIVVGAGISGLSTAYWLNQEDPSLKIAVIEKHRIAFGATGRNAGFVTCGSVEHFNRMIGKHGEQKALEIWQFAEKNLELLKQHIIHTDQDTIEFAQRGAYSLAAQDSEFKELHEVAQIMDKHAIPVEIVNSNQIPQKLGATGFVGGIKYCKDAEVNPVKLAHKMAQLVNADIIEGTCAFGVEESPSGNRILKTDNGDFEASAIVYCLNGYSAQLNPYFNDIIYPTRGQILMMEPIAPFMDGPCYANFYLDYFRQMPSGALLIGGFRQLEKQTEVGYSDHTTDIIQEALHQFVQNHLPQLKDKKVTHRWGGVMGFSKDGEPVIGSLRDDPQVYFMGGFTGHGIGMAFHTAKTLVDLIFGREIPHWISSKRF